MGHACEIRLVNAPQEEVSKVEYLGLFRDVNFPGDGVYRQWQYTYFKGSLRHHIGTARQQPWNVIWDTSWVPDQEEPVKLVARTHERGLSERLPGYRP